MQRRIWTTASEGQGDLDIGHQRNIKKMRRGNKNMQEQVKLRKANKSIGNPTIASK